jgi:hypothetical protein
LVDTIADAVGRKARELVEAHNDEGRDGRIA